MKRLTMGIAALAFLAGCGGATPETAQTPSASPTPTPPATITVFVTMELKQTDFGAKEGQQCAGQKGYDDIRAGTQVKITDASGTVIALGELGAGEARDTWPDLKGTNICRFEAMVPGVQKSSGILGVEVGSRGVVNFTPESGSTTSVTVTLG